eukprot:1766491-Pyramimonas_sp.AAC.1
MLLSLLQGNLPRAEPVVRMAISDYQLPQVRVRRGRHRGGEAPPPPRAGNPAARPRLPDWARFDVQISLQNLRGLDPSVGTRELRNLHLRWSHAKEPKTTLILSKIDLDSVRLNLIRGVCDTCRECRAWDKPGHTVMPFTALPGKFNEEVEF